MFQSNRFSISKLVCLVTLIWFMLNLGSIWYKLIVNWANVEISRGAFVETSIPQFILAELSRYGDEQSLRTLVMSQVAQGNLTAAKEVLSNYVKLVSPRQIDEMTTWITRWSLHLAAKDQQLEADLTMRLLFALDGGVKTYLELSRFYQKLGQPNRAEQFLEEALTLQPDASIFVQLGSLYFEQGKLMLKADDQKAIHLFKLAIQAYKAAIELDPSISVEVNYYLGNIYVRLGSHQDAIHAYQYVAENGEPDYRTFLSLYYLGQIYSAWGKLKEGMDYDLARNYFEQAYALADTGHDRAMVLTGIGGSYIAQKRKIEAIDAYRRALTSDPTYEPAQKALDDLENIQ